MANYNPHAPQNLGQEWVPIRNENLIFNPFANSIERGYSFTLSEARDLDAVRAYVNTMPDRFFMDRAFTASIYPRGAEDQSGPVRSVIIPCTAGIITGNQGASYFFGAANVPAAVWNPSAISSLNIIIGGTTDTSAFFWFGVSQYQNLLQGKRILGVNFLTAVDIGSINGNTLASLTLWMANDVSLIAGTPTGGAVRYTDLVTPTTPTTDIRFDRIALGDVSRFYGVVGINSALTTYNVSQWTYSELARFEASAANRICMMMDTTLNAPASGITNVFIAYAALEVFFCDEARVGFGTHLHQMDDSTAPGEPIGLGASPINVHAPNGATLALNPGDYTVTLSESNLGDSFNGVRTPIPAPFFNEVRQLYQIPTVQGVQVNLPFPLNDEALGRTLTVESTDLIPQLSLHDPAQNQAFVGPHAYGRQAIAEVWGTVTATQDILDSISGPVTTYPQVRFYARRFGDTTVPLTLSGTSPAGGLLVVTNGNYASTPDAAPLDIVADIDLRAEATLFTWIYGSYQTLLGKNQTGGQLSYRLSISTGAKIQFVWSANGTAANANESAVLTSLVGLNGRLAVRATLDVDNGAGQNVVTFYTAPTIAGPWTQLSTPQVNGGTTSIFSSTSILEAGANGGGTIEPLQGTLHALEVRNGINGTVVANPNFSAQAPGTTSFVDGAGRTWTLNGSASIVAGASPSSASITVAEFDLLPEIVDGWKEVTLRFSPAPVVNTGSPPPTFTWSAYGAVIGSRWEILGAAAPAYFGIVGNSLNMAPSIERPWPATYGNTGGTGQVSYVGVGAGAAGDNSSLVPALPSGLMPGDLMLLFAAIRNFGAGSIAVPVPAGWTVIGMASNVAYLGKYYVTGDVAPTVNFSGGVAGATTLAQIAAFRNVQLQTINADVIGNGSAQNVIVPALTVPEDNALLVFIGWKQDDLTSATTTGLGVTTAISRVSSTLGDDASIMWDYQIQRAATNIPASQGFVVVGGASAISVGVTIAFRAKGTGSAINLGWVPQLGNPYTTATTDDPASDATIILAQDMQVVTGFSVTTMTQAVTGIGRQCGIDPCCIPSALLYNQLSWSQFTGLDGSLVFDGITSSFASTPDTAALDIVGDIDLRVEATLPAWVTTGYFPTLISKWNQWQANEQSYLLQVANFANLVLAWTPDGITIKTAASTVPVPVSTGRYAIRATLDVDNGAAGNTVTFYTAPSISGPWTQLGTPVTQAGVTSIFSGTAQGQINGHSGARFTDSYAYTIHAAEIRNGINGSVVANPVFRTLPTGTTSFVDSAGLTWTLNGTASIQNVPYKLELQRSDTIDNQFQTIMRATDPTITSFKDYEARVGIVSSYRIRTLDAYDFPSAWSPTLNISMASPGISGGCIAEGHILIFTTNEVQDGSSNLAYSSVWMDQQVEENFTFPEAGFVTMQAMYNKDFFTAFRPQERGGEQFSRTVLVQAAAIPPETLADFQSLRDMAWDDVSYICVRDEDGNRWLASVLVPSGTVLRDRRLYLAPVEVIEVTATPSEVDP
jgi:hypothetical protein